MGESDEAKAAVQQVKKEMADCCIPVNIQVRRNELKALNAKIDLMKKEFREAYMNLFQNSFNNLRRTIQVKLKAIRFSNKFMKLDSLEKNFTLQRTFTDNARRCK